MLAIHTIVVLAALVCFALATFAFSWPRFNTLHAAFFFTALVLLGVA